MLNMKSLQLAILIDMLAMKNINYLNDYVKIDLETYLSNEIDANDLNDLDDLKNEIESYLLKITNYKNLNDLNSNYRNYLNDVYDYLDSLEIDKNRYDCKEIESV